MKKVSYTFWPCRCCQPPPDPAEAHNLPNKSSGSDPRQVSVASMPDHKRWKSSPRGKPGWKSRRTDEHRVLMKGRG
jgi:hypothetical protein